MDWFKNLKTISLSRGLATPLPKEDCGGHQERKRWRRLRQRNEREVG
jgi:hypothetical protein